MVINPRTCWLLPIVKGWGIDRADKGDKPLFKWALLNGKKGKSSTKKDKKDDKRPFEKRRKRGCIE